MDIIDKELYYFLFIINPSKIWFGSGKNLSGISDPGVNKAPEPGSRGQNDAGSQIRILNTALNRQCKAPHIPSLTRPRCLCRREYYAGCESPITDEVQLSEYLSDYSAWESSSLNLSADRMDESGSVASQVCYSIIVAISEYLS